MKIAVSGASGLIGSALVPALRADGHDVMQLVRRTPRTAEEHRWAPQHRRIDPALLADVDAVVNLAGKPIRPRPWTRGYREQLVASRLDATSTIAEALAAATAADPARPRVLVNASGIGYYGDTGDALIREDAPPGQDFLARLCVQWEGATAPAAESGVRVVLLRTGLVLGREAMLVKVLGLVFRLGLGGRLGSGRQYWPWISLRDEIDAIRHVLTTDLSGPVNVTAPTPATNAEFTRELGRVLRRPTVLPVPAFAISAGLGEFGRASVLGGQRAVPAKLLESGFRFTHTELGEALRVALARN
ncbi:TIGR01777 family oxidoreductase [Blastococcus deserti]|uniref:TIGR01777 family oxidoreductase n=1 Tax=Blastococcus deserti TaxID=2259033 RepID=A0ABW4XCH6_9ACTN